MTELHFPFLELAIFIPLLGALWVRQLKDPQAARQACLLFTGLAFVFTVAAWQDFAFLGATEADDKWHLLPHLLNGFEPFVIDRLSAPLLPLSALLYFLTTVTTLKTKIRRFSFAWTLVSEAILLATLSCKHPPLLIALLIAGTIPPYWELRARGKPTRVYVLHMALFAVALCGGWYIIEREGAIALHSWWGIVPLLIAVSIRSGAVPVHCWMTDLVEHATFGTALLFIVPNVGAYAALRLVMPLGSEVLLRSIGTVSLITAVYAAGMALIQRDGRRFFCYLFLSHSSLVLIGIETATELGVTGALCVWIAVTLSLGGFGLTLRALEARRGTLSLTEFQGLYDHTPALAVCFFLTGLASIGFPGTLGFVGGELLVDGAVGIYPYIGVAVVFAAALNGIAFVKAYFTLFTGKVHSSTVSLAIGMRERLAVLALTGLIVAGGMIPQWSVGARYSAAKELLQSRPQELDDDPDDDDDDEHDEHHKIDRGVAKTAMNDED